ncbi:MAG: serine hydroxymethyltransferase [Patescibacteria group bacterium]
MNYLKETDPEIAEIISRELDRQRRGLEMIASENFTSLAVLQAAGSVLTNKYSEGYPGRRYYGGNQFIDQSENLAIDRAKKLFGAEHANVQSHSGSSANFAAFLAVLKAKGTVLGMDLAAGGHLTHGSKVNFSGKLFRAVTYGVNKQTHRLDMAEIKAIAEKEKPKLIIAGATAYSRQIEWGPFLEIAESVGAYFMVDMAHIAGLVAAKLHPDPIPHADIVTSTTHKTLRGPRGAIILCKINDRIDPAGKKNLAEKIDSAVMPGSQGGPLDHIIAAKAVAFKEALEPDFINYQKQILLNAKALEMIFHQEGIKMVTDGTDNHLLLLDLTDLNITGKEAEKLLDSVGIYTNKNSIPFDPRKPFDPSGLRLGTPALTTRSMKEEEMKKIGQLISQVLKYPKDQKVQDRAKAEVKELVGKFPLYPELD